jgi:hypothetical protein
MTEWEFSSHNRLGRLTYLLDILVDDIRPVFH